MVSNFRMKISKNYSKEIDCHKKDGGNSNVLAIGSSGSGKTSGVVLPLLMDDFSKNPVSFVIQDCKGLLYKHAKEKFIKDGYHVYNIDFNNPSVSNCFNPFHYIKNIEDARKLVRPLVISQIHSDRDMFWEVTSIELISASIMFLKKKFMGCYHNFSSLYDFIKLFGDDYNRYNNEYNDSGVKDMKYIFSENSENSTDNDDTYKDDGTFRSELLKISLNENTDYADTLLGYYNYPDRTFFSVFATSLTAISIFSSEHVKKVIGDNNDIDFNRIAKEKSIVFINPSDVSRVYDPIVNMFFDLCLRKIVKIADSSKNGRLNIPFRFIFDDFASGTAIPDFDKMISNIRSRNISCTILIQSMSQLESLYGEGKSKTIIANCSTLLYLGSNDFEQELYIAKRIDMPYDKVHNMNRDKIIIFEENKKPLIDEKNYVFLDEIHNENKNIKGGELA